MDKFSLFRKNNGIKTEFRNLAELFPDWKKDQEHWLFISPHDDDIIIGSGILLQKALLEGVKISILITTDGSMGYTTEEEKDSIVAIRRDETLESFKRMNISDVTWCNFPDCSLSGYTGKRKALPGDSCIIEGFTGLENAYTYFLRKYSPTRVFLPTGEDLHPDHKLVHQEVMISLFHATGSIWPELGSPLKTLPGIYELAVYCNFPSIPDIKISCSSEVLENKLDAIRAYASQEKIIDKLVDKIKTAEAAEYFREIRFNLYSPDNYSGLF